MSTNAPAAVPQQLNGDEIRRTSNSSSAGSISRYNSKVCLTEPTIASAIDTLSTFTDLSRTPRDLPSEVVDYSVDLNSFFKDPKSKQTEESFTRSLIRSVEKTSYKLRQDRIASRRGPMCRKAVAVGGLVKHSLIGIVKIPLLPVSVIGHIFYPAAKRKTQKLKIESIIQKMKNNTPKLDGFEGTIKPIIASFFNSNHVNVVTYSDETTHRVFIKMILLCKTFNQKFDEHYMGKAKFKRRDDRLNLLNIELIKLVKKEREALISSEIEVSESEINIANNDNELAKSLLKWVDLNNEHNKLRKNRRNAAVVRAIPAMIEHSLTLRGLALSFLQVRKNFKLLKLNKLDKSEKISARAISNERFAYFAAIHNLFEGIKKQFKDIDFSELDIDLSKITVIPQPHYPDRDPPTI